jgi:hypothetical protein
MGAVQKERAKDRWANEVARVAMGGRDAVKVAAPRAHPVITALAYMRIYGLTQVELAKQLGTTQKTVSLVLNGEVLPDSRLRRAFETVCWIPPARWDHG